MKNALAAMYARARSEQGAELIELALVTPILLIVTIGVLDFGLLFQRYNVVTNAAREGARVAVLAGSTADSAVSRVNAYLNAGGLDSTAAMVTVANVKIVTLSGGRPANGVRVTVAYPYQFLFLISIVGWFGPQTIPPTTLRAVATMRSEVQF